MTQHILPAHHTQIMKKTLALIITAFSATLFTSCSDNNDATYSNVVAELCELHTAAQISDYIINDRNERLPFGKPITLTWASQADTIYRALLYYDKPAASTTITPLSLDLVPVLDPYAKDKVKGWQEMNDAVTLRSAWLSKNAKYLNLDIGMKSGTTTDNKKHVIALVADTTIAEGTHRHHKFHFCHNQNGIPEFYTTYSYISIPITDMPQGDTISINIPTGKGWEQKTWVKE